MAQNNKDAGTTPADRFFTAGGKWWVISCAFVVLLGLALVFVLLPWGGGDEKPALSVSAPAPGPAVDTSGAWSDAGCAGTSPDATIPTSGPAVRWVPLGHMSTPVSDELGPRRITGPLRECFQHSPSGALMAANVILQAGAAGPEAARTVYTTQITAGPAQQYLLGQSTSGSASPAGFKFGACAPERCQITILVTAGGYYAQTPLSLVWIGGDWKIDGSGHSFEPSVAQTPPAGYIPWGPNV